MASPDHQPKPSLLPGGYILRPAGPSDFETVLHLRVAQNQADYQVDGLTDSLMRESWSAPGFHPGFDHWLVCTPGGKPLAYGEVRDDGDGYFDVILALVEGEIAGAALNFYAPETQTAWVDHLGTRRAFRKRGIGMALLAHSLNVFYRRGFPTARLSVDSHSLTHAPRLYEQAGFQAVMGYHIVTSQVFLVISI